MHCKCLQNWKKNDKRKIEWTEECTKQFDEAKQALANVTLLTCPNSEYKLSLHVDASNTAAGGVIQQLESYGSQLVSFPKKSETQKRYSSNTSASTPQSDISRTI